MEVLFFQGDLSHWCEDEQLYSNRPRVANDQKPIEILEDCDLRVDSHNSKFIPDS